MRLNGMTGLLILLSPFFVDFGPFRCKKKVNPEGSPCLNTLYITVYSSKERTHFAALNRAKKSAHAAAAAKGLSLVQRAAPYLLGISAGSNQ